MNHSMDVNSKNVDNLINDCWVSIRNNVENELQPISSEKTLVFVFAMELVKRVGSNLIVDFESQCYETLQGSSKYLDLLFYTDDNFKISLEFKFPSGTPDQKDTRKKIYRDLGRLNFLKKNSTHSVGYFLMATSVDSFLNKGNYSNYPDMITSHNHSVFPENNIIVDGANLNGLSVSFHWENIEEKRYATSNKTKFVRSGRYAWLKPIKV